MEIGSFFLIFLSLAILSIFTGLILWGIKSEQFKNVEEIKYKIFEDDEE